MFGQEFSEDWWSEHSATFGDRLAAAREAAGMTQKELAKRLGVKASSLRAWEEDLNEPRANRLSMLSGLLNVSLPWLLTGEGAGVEVAPAVEGPELSEILREMRALQAQARQTAEALGKLEKRLRAMEPAS